MKKKVITCILTMKQLKGSNYCMPTVLRIAGYRFFFYSGDSDEPPHVHIENGDNVAKFWLDPVMLEKSRGFASKELKKLYGLVEENRDALMKSWEDYFENSNTTS